MKINIYPFVLLRRTFVRQLTRDDCGQACIAMLLRYAGKSDMAHTFLMNSPSGTQSLLSLRDSMGHFGFSAQCVTMTLAFLSQIEQPCILHTEDAEGNRHYQICYGLYSRWGRKRFLMADPANHFYLVDPEKLDRIWRTKAAVYIEDIQCDLSAYRRSPLRSIIVSNYVPGIVWIIMPVLTLINALFGVALSFLLERGFMYANTFGSVHLIIAFVILLLMISVFKSAFSLLRQVILLKINHRIRKSLFDRLTRRIHAIGKERYADSFDWIKRALHEISLMQNALTVFVSTLFSEGALLVLLTAAVFYMVPAAGTVLLFFFTVLIGSSLYASPGLIYKNALIRQKSAAVERSLIEALLTEGAASGNMQKNEAAHFSVAEQQAMAISKSGFLQEVVGALAIALILAIASLQLYHLQLSYASLMFVVILSYVAVSVTPRLFGAYLVFAEAAEVFLQFDLRTKR